MLSCAVENLQVVNHYSHYRARCMQLLLIFLRNILIQLMILWRVCWVWKCWNVLTWIWTFQLEDCDYGSLVRFEPWPRRLV